MGQSISRRALLRSGFYTTVTVTLAACAGPLIQDAPPQALQEAQANGTPEPHPESAGATGNGAGTEAGDVAQSTIQNGVQLDATPACADDDEPTPAQTAGPFYTPDAPLRASLLEPGLAGERLLVTGYVLSRECVPIGGALLDFWQADAQGVYDNSGYTLRGHQFADDAGRYQLETILPGLYPGRTRHIHVRVQPPGGAILTTQLYFPNEPQNARDGIYRPDLEMAVRTGDPLIATFDFVLAV
jgi:protocatechuate 3,4-dioxygenase beta subunit